ncbi:MAG: hypothetical protein JNJ82_04640 [Opitutaceae bacterium]|nr:hypothetical protein [Opitutaceae bacterium]
MMGIHDAQSELFSYRVDLDKRVHAQHPLRRVLALVDFNLARAAVAHTYGDNAKRSSCTPFASALRPVWSTAPRSMWMGA